MDKQSQRASTDANSLRNSYRSISRSGFIQTLAGENDTDMKKSRIYNLPSYKKIDLNSRLDMVVVFQTIEISRLSQQIETLRVALMDYQRQVNNYRNYEIQIRELNEKVCEYEEERGQYQEEIEKLNLICQQLYADLEREKELNSERSETDRVIGEDLKRQKERGGELSQQIEKWKNRLQALQKSKQAELQELKLAMENQRKSVLNKQLNQLQTKYTTEIKSLQKQIHNLRESLSSGKQTQKQLQIQLTKRQIELQNMTLLKGQVKQYENRFSQIENEFLKLNDLLRKKQEQQQKYREDEKKLTTKVKEYQKKFDQDYKQKIKEHQTLDKNHKELKEKFIRLQLENQHLQQADSKANKLQNLLNQAGDEIDRLNMIIKDKIKYIEAWNQKYNLLQVKFTELQQARQTEAGKLENRLMEKEKELTRLGMTAKNRLEEIQALKDKNTKLQKSLTTVSTQLKGENEHLQQKNDQLSISLKQLQCAILELKHEHTSLKQKQQELARYKQQLEPQYKKQLHTLALTIKQKDDHSCMQQKKLEHMKKNTQTTSESFKEQIQALTKKNNQLVKFADQLHNSISQKAKQIKMFKQAIASIDQRVAECQGVEKKLAGVIGDKEKIMQQLAQLQQENNSLFDKCLAIENKVFALEKQLFEKAQQNSTLLNQLNYLQEQKLIVSAQIQQASSQLKSSFERERSALAKHKQLQKVIEELEQKAKVTCQRLSKREKDNVVSQQEYQAEASRVKEEMARWKQKVEGLEQQLHQARMEAKKQESLRESQTRQFESSLQSLKSQCQKLSLESNRQLTLVESQLKTQLEHHKANHLKQKQQAQTLEPKLKQSAQIISKLQQKCKKLQEQMQQLQKELKHSQSQRQSLQKELRAKKQQIDQCDRAMQEREEKQLKQKKSVKSEIQSKDLLYEKLKKLHQKQRQHFSQQINLLQTDKQKLLKNITKHQQQNTNLNHQLQKALFQGRNSKHFLEDFTAIKRQSQSITQLLHQLTTRYFISSNTTTPSHQLYIETQLKTVKQIVQHNLKLYSETVAIYQAKITDLIDKNQHQLQQFNQLNENHSKLKDSLISIESKHKILLYEHQQMLVQQQKESQRLSRDIKLGSNPSVMSPTKQQKRNISTLFQSMVDSSSSIIEPLTKDNQGDVETSKRLNASGIRSMKNLITPFGGGGNVVSPKANKVDGDMVESTVFEVSGSRKSSEYFNRFKN